MTKADKWFLAALGFAALMFIGFFTGCDTLILAPIPPMLICLFKSLDHFSIGG